MISLLDTRYVSNRMVSRIVVQTHLFRMSYPDQNMSIYVYKYASLFSQLEQMGNDAAIPETHKTPILLASLDQQCSLESTDASLRTKYISELTCFYVTTTLLDDYNAKQMTSSQSHLGSRNIKRPHSRHKGGSAGGNSEGSKLNGETPRSNDTSDFVATVRALAAALKYIKSERSTKSGDHHCSLCDRSEHT